MLKIYRRKNVWWVRGTIAGRRIHQTTGHKDEGAAAEACAALIKGPPDYLLRPKDKLEAVAWAIWRETYRHDLPKEWAELRKGSLHYERVMAAAQAAIETIGGTNDGARWLPIPGYPDYEASSNGHIRRARRANGHPSYHLLRPTESPWGHLKVSVYHGGKQLRTGVHRLVALTFIGPPPPDKPVACHNNGNPRDNRPENLRWDTYKENGRDAVRHRAERMGRRILVPPPA